VTHVFNGMSPLHHREPGLIGAASHYHLNTEIICDGIHVHPAVVEMMFKAMPDQMILISDSINPTGMADGVYAAGGLPITVQNQKALLSDGTIAGSLITLYDAVRNAIAFGVSEENAILSATYYPAKALHLEDTIGRIGIGKRADLLLVSEKFELNEVILRGKCLNIHHLLPLFE
ncbi:MAG: amidohydrolase family protein, partial [Clostridiales bacterium]|nr:amidohydrolase family protein [Clostridiales bacterium]